MLKHLVIFTFEKDFLKKEHIEEYARAFEIIKEAFDGITSVHIRRNCVNRPSNMDLMVEMDLTGEDILPLYLNHPEHVRMGNKYNPHVTARASFDYEY
ncbi:MAG: Dabb family protein [Butyrivibrio sp.]|nr:Dabb family protein [Butyrivibrio sp.]